MDTAKTEVIEEIERRLQIGKTDEFVKYTYLETDQSEIPNYSHFFIRPQEFGWKEEVFFEITPRTCRAHDFCPWGMQISSPIQFRSSSLQGIGGIGGCPMLHTRLQFVTPEVRELFDSEGISGLEYGRFEDLDGAAEPGFVAKVMHGAHQSGTKIIARPCPDHHSIGGCFVFNLQEPKDGLRYDLQMIDRVTVNGIDYAYHYPYLVASQKLLRLLLTHCVGALESVTIMLDQPFRPLTVS